MKMRCITKYIFVIIVMLIISIYGLLSWINIINRSMFLNDTKRHVEWGEMYPVSQKGVEIEVSPNRSSYSVLVKGIDRIGNKTSRILSKIKKHMYCNDLALAIGYHTNNLISNGSIRENYLRLENGYWVQKTKKEDTFNYAKHYIEFSDYLNENNIPFIYVQPPVRECIDNQTIPYGTDNSRNSNIDCFIEELKRHQIDVLDLRKYIQKEENGFDYFFRTDHHWKPLLALKAAQWIESYIVDNYNIPLDLTYNDLKDYETITYERLMFSGVARELGRLIEPGEDYTVMNPLFDTDYHIISLGDNIDKNGRFDEAVINYQLLNKLQNGFEDNANGIYISSGSTLVEITNKKSENDIHILMIRDSFGSTLSPYLSLSCKELDLIDIRPDNGNFTGSIREYVRQNRPDIVIILEYYPENYQIK